MQQVIDSTTIFIHQTEMQMLTALDLCDLAKTFQELLAKLVYENMMTSGSWQSNLLSLHNSLNLAKAFVKPLATLAKKSCDQALAQTMIISCTDAWWCHQIETFSALLDLCTGNSPVTGEFPAQRAVMRSFDVSFDLRLNKRLSKQSRGWWFDRLLCSLWPSF